MSVQEVKPVFAWGFSLRAPKWLVPLFNSNMFSSEREALASALPIHHAFLGADEAVFAPIPKAAPSPVVPTSALDDDSEDYGSAVRVAPDPADAAEDAWLAGLDGPLLGDDGFELARTALAADDAADLLGPHLQPACSFQDGAAADRPLRDPAPESAADSARAPLASRAGARPSSPKPAATRLPSPSSLSPSRAVRSSQGSMPQMPQMASSSQVVAPVAAAAVDVNLLEDEEIASMVRRGAMASHALERQLSDKERAVAIRRRLVADELPAGLSTLPYSGMDYDAVYGRCCENVVGFVALPVGIAGAAASGRRGVPRAAGDDRGLLGR
jgi:hypothetical protein